MPPPTTSTTSTAAAAGGVAGGSKATLDDVDLGSDKTPASDRSAIAAASSWWRRRPSPAEVRASTRSLLSATGFHVCVVILVVVDCALVIAELLIDLDVFSEKASEGGPSRPPPAQSNSTGRAAGATVLAAETADAVAAEVAAGADLPAAARALHFCSIAILSVFMLETAAKVFAYGREFLHHKLEVADAVIVVVSFALDVAFADDEEATSAFGLLVALRLWRVARIVNGIIISVKAQAASQVEKERSLRSEAEKELSSFAEFCAAQEREIDLLRALLAQHGVVAPKVDKPSIPRSKVNAAAEANMYLAMPALGGADGRRPVLV